ncbi:PglL family O-oligosaccharyltransferase [Paludibacterium paludis]|uniref:Polymerase n=1 Tax=Paludibacterium paludis TaxID=1225769 RepID=A0A918U8N3_9NEIS|nr:O-antigen ligase family protein [Paludibacterium paludis]GGY10110.1 hypothetical protein GCM10011289_11300 [Paludibacterium paludis]
MNWKSLSLGLSLLLWCLVAIIPFASRTHYLPLPQWWGEMETVWFALGSLLFALPLREALNRLPRAAIWCLMLGLVWALQPWLVPVLFPGLNTVTALAWCVLALLALAGSTLREELGNGELTIWLARALMAGALVQSLIGLAQVTGLAELSNGILFYDSEHPTTNIFGHIGQRNQFAHYLMWGMLAGVFLRSVNRLGKLPFLAWTLWLSVMLAFAGSRTILLYVFAVAAVALVWHLRIRSEASRRMLNGMLLASLAIILVQFALPMVNHLVSSLLHKNVGVASGMERLAANGDDMASRRFAEMHKAWLVFRAHPWWGTGWSQFASQSVELQTLPEFAKAGFNSGLFTNAHNLVLQLLAEMGGVATAIVLGGFAWSVWPYFSERAEVEGFLPLACLSVSAIHSMLEYPLWYLYFLAMVVVFVSLAPGRQMRAGLPIKAMLVALLLVLMGVSAMAYAPYRELVNLYTPTENGAKDAQRVERLTTLIRERPLYAYHALYTLDNYLEGTSENLGVNRQWVDLMAAIRPYPDVLLKKAKLEALAGEGAKARATLGLALASFPTYARYYIEELSDGPPAFGPLLRQAHEGWERLPEKYKKTTD